MLAALNEAEDNIDHYELEYAGNNNQFSTVGRVNTGEGKLALDKYAFTDKINTPFGVRNYRLKTVQKSGKINYSDTVQLNLKGYVRVLPNPFTNDLYLQVQLANAATVRVTLLDISGRSAFSTTEKLNAGTNNMHLVMRLVLHPAFM